MHLDRFLRVATLAAGASLVSLNAQAVAAVPAPADYSFDFFATCSDCDLNVGDGGTKAVATLELTNYVLGTEFDSSNFVQFSYVGSDLVAPYQLTVDPMGFGVLSSGATDFSPITTFFSLHGQIGTAEGAYRVQLRFDNGLGFETSTAAAGSGAPNWFTCAPSPTGIMQSGTCNWAANADTGVGQWNGPMAAVPEPSTWALMGVGLLGLAGVSRRRAKG